MGLFDKAGEAFDILPGVDLGKVRNLVDMLWDHRDELIDMITRLPGLMGDAGEQMHAAGSGAEAAAQLLTGDLLAMTESAADALAACHDQLSTVAGMLGEVGDVLDRVPLMGDIAEPVTKGLQAVRMVSDRLDDVGNQVRGIGGGLSSVGEGLGSMGGSLRGGGAALAALSGRDVAKAEAKPKAGPPAKPAAKAGPPSKPAPKPASKPAAKAAPKPAAKSAPAPKPKAAPKAKPAPKGKSGSLDGLGPR